MPSENLGDKTEQPTERRRREAREQGQVAKSTDLNVAAVTLAASIALVMFGGPLFGTLRELLVHYLTGPIRLQIDPSSLIQELWAIVRVISQNLVPFMLAILVGSLLINSVQVGFVLSPDLLAPKLSRLNPIDGLKRIASIRALVRLGISLAKLLVLGGVAAWYISYQLPYLLALMNVSPPQIARGTGDAIIMLSFLLACSLLVLALIDFAFQKWKHEQELMMTKQEVRDEMKQMEGDPLIRQRRREAHRKLAQAREIQQVRDADVVITNPTHIAVALKYDPETMSAPTVIAKGMGEIAERIRGVATEHGVPIVERKELARALYREVKTGQSIPLEMYEVFVEIMAYVYRLTGKAPKGLS